MSGRFLAVVERALAKRPEDRYPDAEALATAIREALSGAAEGRRWLRSPPAAARSQGEHRAADPVGKGGQGQCLSLKVALRQAKPGMEIILLPGLYRESVVVDKDVTIQALGKPGEVVLEGVSGPALVLDARSASLHGFTLRAPEGEVALRVTSGASSLEGCVMDGQVAGAEVKAGAAPRFVDCTFRCSGGSGLVVAEGGQTRLQGGVVEGFRDTGILVGSGAQISLHGVQVGPGDGVGLKVQARAQVVVEDSGFTALSGAVEVEPDGHVQLTRCRLLDSRFAGLLALERSHAVLESCDLGNHTCSGAHVLAGANVMFRQCRMVANAGFGLSVMDRGLATLDGCVIQANGGAGLLIHHGATVQARGCSISEGRSMGVDCDEGGQAVLEACEISGNAGPGVQVEPGGSLLLVRVHPEGWPRHGAAAAGGLPGHPGRMRRPSECPGRDPAGQGCGGSGHAGNQPHRGRFPPGGWEWAPGEDGAALGSA